MIEIIQTIVFMIALISSLGVITDILELLVADLTNRNATPSPYVGWIAIISWTILYYLTIKY